MAYSVDIEDVVWKIIDVLGDGFAAKLDAIEVAKTDPAITLEDVEKWYFGDKDFNPSVQNMPAVIVKGRGFVPEATATDKRYRDNPIRIEIECYIGVDVNTTLTKDSRTYDFDEILDIKVMRYARAIVELLIENEQLASKASLLNFTDVMLSNVLPFEGIMVKACRIEVEYLGIINTIS